MSDHNFVEVLVFNHDAMLWDQEYLHYEGVAHLREHGYIIRFNPIDHSDPSTADYTQAMYTMLDGRRGKLKSPRGKGRFNG